MFAQQTSIKNISVDASLPSNLIYEVVQDKIGYLWIATEKGLLMFDGDDFTQINQLKTTTLLVQNSIIYAGLENGLFIKNKSKEQFIKSKKVVKIVSFDDEIFVATTEGLYNLKQNNLQPIKINTTIDFSVINDLIFCKNAIYIASNKGLWIVDNLLKPTTINRIITKNIISLEKFQEKVIAATLQNGLFLIAGNAIEKEISTLKNITVVKKLKNEIWVTSKTDGIEVFVLPSFTFKQKINKYNSLPTNAINNVFKDNQNTTWLATNDGLYKINAINFLIEPNLKPTIYFEKLQVNHQNRDAVLFDKNVKFLHADNNISITFKSVDISNPKKIRYRYQLADGFSPWSKNNTVQFANLSADNYKFQVQSKIANRKSAIKSFSFTVDAPFYKKAWFIFTVIISLLLIGYFSLDYYLRQLNKSHEKRIDTLKLQNRLLSLEQKALQLQMNPHFIFNVLNGIKALGNAGKINDLNSTISKFSVLLRGILQNSRKEEITLHEEIHLLKNYIELEQRMSSKNFTYSIHKSLNNMDANEILIPTMLLQPFVENCVQHAFQNNTLGQMTINFEVKHHFLNCTVIDNGIGILESKRRKENSNHTSVALKVSKERLHILSPKSAFSVKEIVTENEIKGTEVSFKIPLKTDY
ncbi:sensor histidine kinase [Polaribacter sp. IC063]|uniref:sensor histidine kinase n=1 Tax=Polaribacter sp. IC063 TaxID=57031 RepID=UPI0016792905|nr:sensor histidine kinase [Polaribacter sp. IC063]